MTPSWPFSSPSAESTAWLENASKVAWRAMKSPHTASSSQQPLLFSPIIWSISMSNYSSSKRSHARKKRVCTVEATAKGLINTCIFHSMQSTRHLKALFHRQMLDTCLEAACSKISWWLSGQAAQHAPCILMRLCVLMLHLLCREE